MSQEYQITQQQFVRACWYAQRSQRRILVVALYLVLVLFPVVTGFKAAAILATVIVALLLTGFLALFLPRLHGWRFGRIYRQNPLLQKSQQLDMQPTGFVLRSANGESRYRFAELKRVDVLDDMVLVYPTTTLFHMIPVGLLDDFALAQFRALA